MDGLYWVGDPPTLVRCGFLAGCCAVVLVRSLLPKEGEGDSKVGNSALDDFYTFRRNYLCGYLPAMLADWMMGAHVYTLYSFYGYTMHEIGLLFIAGFGSSMVFGTVIGGMADQYGRKKLCQW